jgi:hypothetical protein
LWYNNSIINNKGDDMYYPISHVLSAFPKWVDAQNKSVFSYINLSDIQVRIAIVATAAFFAFAATIAAIALTGGFAAVPIVLVAGATVTAAVGIVDGAFITYIFRQAFDDRKREKSLLEAYARTQAEREAYARAQAKRERDARAQEQTPILGEVDKILVSIQVKAETRATVAEQQRAKLEEKLPPRVRRYGRLDASILKQFKKVPRNHHVSFDRDVQNRLVDSRESHSRRRVSVNFLAERDRALAIARENGLEYI